VSTPATPPALGRRPADPARYANTILLRLTGAVPAHPLIADHLSKVPAWMLGGNDRYGTCLTPETKVLTADLLWVPVGELAEGDHLLGFDELPRGGNAGRQYCRSVVEDAKVVRKECYDLVFEDGTHVRCSADHRWLVSSTVQGQLQTQQWLRTDEMRASAPRQTKVIKPLDVWETDDSRAAGYLAAAFDGEGCLEQTRHGKYANRVNFVQSDNPMLAEAERCLKELGYPFNHTITSSGQRLRVDGTRRFDKHRLEVSPRSEYIRFLGSVRPVRLLPKLEIGRLGRIDGRAVRLVSIERAGIRDVVKLETSSKTYFAAGLASHNCGPTYVANLAVLTWKYLLGLDISVSDDAIFDLYRRSGNPNFDPATDADDNGVDMTVMLSALVSGGITITHSDGGTELVKPICFAKHGTGVDLVRAVTSIFGASGLGVDLDVAQQTQTDAHLWDYVANSPGWGGHAIPGGAYTSSAAPGTADVTCITWTEKVGMTDLFISRQLAEAYAVVWQPLWDHPAFQAGVDQAALAADYTACTGRPFPLPVPPGPPGPAVRIDPADQALHDNTHVRAFLAGHRGSEVFQAAGAILDWERAKGFTTIP